MNADILVQILVVKTGPWVTLSTLNKSYIQIDTEMVLRPKQYKTNQCFAIPVHMVSQILRLHPGSHGNMNHVLMFWPVSALCTVNYFFHDCATHLFFYVYLYLECFYALFYTPLYYKVWAVVSCFHILVLTIHLFPLFIDNVLSLSLGI